MLANEQDPKKKKKKPGLLFDKMGLDQGSETYQPKTMPSPMDQPGGIFTGSPEAALNLRNRDTAVGTKVEEKLRSRRGATNG
jgi:hypothetical protein